MTHHAHGWLAHLLAWTPLVLGQFGFDFDFFSGGLTGFFSGLLTQIVNLFLFLWNTLLTIFRFILSALELVFNFFYKLLVDVYHGLRWLWEIVVKGFLTKVLHLYTRVRDFLQRVFGPILRILRRLQQIYRDYFRRIILPIINLIQHVRQVLLIFRVLHFKFAQKLDNYLAGLEARIVHNFLFIMQTLNSVISTISLVIDPTLIIRRSVFGATALASIGALKRIIFWGGGKKLSPAAAQRQQATNDLLKPDTKWVVRSDRTAYVWNDTLQPISDAFDAKLLELSDQTLRP